MRTELPALGEEKGILQKIQQIGLEIKRMHCWRGWELQAEGTPWWPHWLWVTHFIHKELRFVSPGVSPETLSPSTEMEVWLLCFQEKPS